MPRNVGVELFKKLEKNLTDKAFLKRVDMSKKDMSALLSNKGWKLLSAEIMGSEDKSCKYIENISRDTISSICGTPEGGWLKYCYDCTLLFLFPDIDIEPVDEKYYQGRLILSEILRTIYLLDRRKREFSPVFDFDILTREEYEEELTGKEYEKFIAADRSEYIYEFMRIGAEITPFNTLAHVAGVHHVALHVGRQLKALGLPVDLALVSGSAASHDIGKFGCKKNELKRVPHYHYYYSDVCMKRLKMPRIAHIASNHSTWDLELEDLSVESLLLIYADFRVKSIRNEDGAEEAKFYSLKQAFDVILSKLENVDAAKEARYRKVYNKLHDFEEYITSLGVITEVDQDGPDPKQWKTESLLDGDEVVDRIKYLAIRHNIEVMSKFGNETEFANLLEEARSDKNWKNVRAYINTLKEYYAYMSQNQKQMSLRFLKELSVHREGDIRRMAAGLVGSIIASYEEESRKELPPSAKGLMMAQSYALFREYISYVIYPDLTSTEQQKRWMGYSFKAALSNLLEETDGVDRKCYLDDFLEVMDEKSFNEVSVFIILDTLLEIPLKYCTPLDIVKMLNYCHAAINKGNLEIKVSALRVARYIAENSEIELTSEMRGIIADIASSVSEEDENVCIVYLKYKIYRALNEDAQAAMYSERLLVQEKKSSDIFRENLKVGTPWNIKAVNIELLMDQLERQKAGAPKIIEEFYVATHFSNLLKVSERVTVRHTAGKALIRVFEMLSWDKRNELAVELTKGLEIGEYQFSKYIPDYLGVLVMSLHPAELDEIILTFSELMESGNEKVASVTLDTLGVMINHYSSYEEKFADFAEENGARKDKILGMILKGMADYHEAISEEAFMVLGQNIFGSDLLSLEDKADIFVRINKKMLTLIEDNKDETLRFFNNASALNHIYRFISDYQFEFGDINTKKHSKVAFFPGTFDPFSLGHKGIVTEIRNHGFEVYLALDEFSWSKKTQPRLFRKKIMTMSCADEIDVYVFPDNMPVNIANKDNIKALKELFAGRDLYLVVGSDVIANASSYRIEEEENSVQSLNHVVFKRESQEQGGEAEMAYKEHAKNITGEIFELTLPIHLEDISSTRIRNNIDEGNDISNLIDSVAQSYIYENALYLREAQYKGVLNANEMQFETFKNERGRISSVEMTYNDRGTSRTNKSFMHLVKAVDLYGEFQDENLSGYIREKGLGKILVIDDIQMDSSMANEEACQLILTETLAEALRNDYTYAVYKKNPDNADDKIIRSVLKRQGFKEIEIDGKATGCLAVDMRNPVIITRNMETVLKNPFNKNKRVMRTLREAHAKMQDALVNVYPDTLILSVNSSVLDNRVMHKVTEVNGVPSKPTKPRKLGPAMCVPFGKILTGMAVPNTVTKTLHTEKCFYSDLQDFEITEAPFYSSLDDQVKTIKSFMRPVILVDDVLHKGFRVKILDKILNENQVNVQKLIVGILSGRGRDLITMQNREVDSVYFIPNLRASFTETWMYPFIGGDGVYRRGESGDRRHMYICMILPYAVSSFMKDCSVSAVYDFSMVCLENTRDILKVLEEEYQREYKKKLTMERLSEAISNPKIPDAGECLKFDRTIAASEYLESDIERLVRLKTSI